LLLAGPLAADVYHLRDGDRITGKTLYRGSRSISVQTPYGRLSIPRNRIARIVHADGREEVLNPLAAPAAPAAPAPVASVVLVVTGSTFWYAWDRDKGAEVDPTLRLQVRLDEASVATYADGRPDPEEIRGALVNSFSFGPEDVKVTAGEGAQVLAPEARPGRIVLKLELPTELAGEKRLRLAYQVNEGTASSPAWRDLVESSLEVEIKPDATSFVQVRQDRGRMEFSGLLRKKMKNVETFRVETRAE
jgi:hypothetical protein